MRLFSYIVAHDTGFSPNPFWGYCTLADCKPVIRGTATKGDWIVGLAPKAHQNKIIYAMRVAEVLGFAEYFNDKRFVAKIPNYAKKDAIYRCGDNIYKPLPNGGFEQLESMHSKGLEEDINRKVHDLNGKNVLISKEFYYFGSQPLDLPEKLQQLRVGRGHKCTDNKEIISAFLEFIKRQPVGINAQPSKWPENDEPCKVKCK